MANFWLDTASGMFPCAVESLHARAPVEAVGETARGFLGSDGDGSSCWVASCPTSAVRLRPELPNERSALRPESRRLAAGRQLQSRAS